MDTTLWPALSGVYIVAQVLLLLLSRRRRGRRRLLRGLLRLLLATC